LAEPEELHGDGALAAATRFGNFGNAGFVVIAAVQQGAVAVIEFLKAAFEGGEQTGFLDGSESFGEAGVCEGGEIIGISCSERAVLAHVIAQEVEGDAADPRSKGLACVELAQPPECGDKGFLSEIFGLVRIAEPDCQKCPYSVLVAGHQFAIGSEASAFGGSHEIRFGRILSHHGMIVAGSGRGHRNLPCPENADGLMSPR
jgi:hypothetical protein